MSFIEKPNEGYHLYNRFSADFTDNTVRLNNRDYPLGAIQCSLQIHCQAS